MVALSFLDKERVYWHLGYGAARLGSPEGLGGGIDAADIARVEEACNTITSEYMAQKVLEQLDICDATEEAARLVSDSFRYSVKEQYQGDVNRTILREELDDIRRWRDEYLHVTNELAKMLHVANYRHPSSDRYRFERSGAEYVMAIPGPADTSVASRQQEFMRLAGSFGI